MTRRAHNVDLERTEAARFEDPRSYVTHEGHEFLFGNDVRNRRQEVFDRDRGICGGCKKLVGWNYFHMHHRQGGNVGRCTCMHNLEVLCPSCHANEHVQPKWGGL
jgi:5-methylcytosine-specific restriction endonuclease McrA